MQFLNENKNITSTLVQFIKENKKLHQYFDLNFDGGFEEFVDEIKRRLEKIK